MKRVVQIFLVVLAIGTLGQWGLSTQAPTLLKTGPFRYIVQTQAKDQGSFAETIQWIRTHGYDVAGVSIPKGQVEVITDNEGIKYLSHQGYTGFVRAEKLPEIGLDPRFLNPERLNLKLQDLVKAYPQLAHLESIGSTLQGRPIQALLVSTTPSVDDPHYFDKPTIIFDGLHHAREIMTPEIVVDVAETLLKGNASGDATAQTILAKWNIWLVPMVNPDGSNIVWTQDTWWRKNAHSDAGSTFGVDINRNYDYKWNTCNGSSGYKGADDYHGTAASSEPETVALENLAARVHPTASLSYHSYSELVLYPFGCRGVYSPDHQMYKQVAAELSKRLPADDGRGDYTPGTPWELLYAVDGSSMDFMYGKYGAFAYTFEVNQDFHPDYSLREPTLVKHREAWKYFLTRTLENMLSVSVVNASHEPVLATFSIMDAHQKSMTQIFKTNPHGRFFKILDPGHYTVRIQTPSQVIKMGGDVGMGLTQWKVIAE